MWQKMLQVGSGGSGGGELIIEEVYKQSTASGAYATVIVDENNAVYYCAFGSTDGNQTYTMMVEYNAQDDDITILGGNSSVVPATYNSSTKTISFQKNSIYSELGKILKIYCG